MSIICIYVYKKWDIYMWSPCRGSWEYHFFRASSNYKILHELNSIHGLTHGVLVNGMCEQYHPWSLTASP